MRQTAQRWQREVTFWRHARRAYPLGTVVGPGLVVLAAVASFATMVATGRLVTAVVDGDPVWTWLALVVAGMITQPVAMAALDAVGAVHQVRLTEQRHRMIAEAALAPHGIGHLEDPQQAGRVAALTEHVRSAVGLQEIGSVWRVLAIRATGVAALVVVASWSWWIALAVLLAQLVQGHLFTSYIDVVNRELLTESSVERRRARYLFQRLTVRDAAKEVRLFGLTPWLLGEYARTWEAVNDNSIRARRGAMRRSLAGAVLLSAGIAAALAWLVRDAWVGAVGVGAVVTIVQGIDGLASFGALGDQSVHSGRARETELRLAELVAGAAGLPALTTAASTAGRGAARVDLDDVTFTYPSRTEPTLRGLDLHVPAGQSVAIVGVNGVGKSTLIKLLCGLYPPDAGTVRIDGLDPAAADDVRRRVAVIFQEFVRYHLSLRDNVTMSEGREPGAFEEALADAAGEDVLKRVGGDWDTVLDPGYAGGTDLSGGQWQRVALARAMLAVRRGAGVLVLDEPTAALDVRAEAQIFDRFLQVTRGVTTILVSHRLSSVRHAERIVVLGPDGIVEDGSHEELLARDGDYARMFRLQAARFASAGGQAQA